MIKIVPDPPLAYTLPASASFGSCDGSHPPLFAIQPGVDIEDALVHVSVLLRAAYEINTQVVEKTDESTREFLWGSQQLLEMAKSLTLAVLDGIEAR
ncbi:DUF6124 family protein [Pseudomonas fontis]|uniref:DUF3077 domain-containing protein n=1 Tax=Pseudomonas fontis TaxID=2942633 RepID=A0ABT5NZZ8_9PSED|nr:DUF3077 domain-containing protein [Pseudomonas fontis]MDD0976359.1 DUF3077 domain-containing protein [Pseudomonas fontis]MDD0993755.1 DUF3077 domain-containing protein [Pseudomonas fontis]